MADMFGTCSDEHKREGDFDEVYLFHNDSELESANSLDRFKSDDETAIDLKEIIVDQPSF